MSTTSALPPVVAFDAAGEPDANRLGGKGASLVKMVGLGMPVPPGSSSAPTSAATTCARAHCPPP